jgi:predicted transcriptional regulator
VARPEVKGRSDLRARGLTQMEIGKRLGVTQQAVGHMLRLAEVEG